MSQLFLIILSFCYTVERFAIERSRCELLFRGRFAIVEWVILLKDNLGQLDVNSRQFFLIQKYASLRLLQKYL